MTTGRPDWNSPASTTRSSPFGRSGSCCLTTDRSNRRAILPNRAMASPRLVSNRRCSKERPSRLAAASKLGDRSLGGGAGFLALDVDPGRRQAVQHRRRDHRIEGEGGGGDVGLEGRCDGKGEFGGRIAGGLEGEIDDEVLDHGPISGWRLLRERNGRRLAGGDNGTACGGEPRSSAAAVLDQRQRQARAANAGRKLRPATQRHFLALPSLSNWET